MSAILRSFDIKSIYIAILRARFMATSQKGLDCGSKEGQGWIRCGSRGVQVWMQCVSGVAGTSAKAVKLQEKNGQLYLLSPLPSLLSFLLPFLLPSLLPLLLPLSNCLSGNVIKRKTLQIRGLVSRKTLKMAAGEKIDAAFRLSWVHWPFYGDADATCMHRWTAQWRVEGGEKSGGCLHYSLDMLSKSEIKFARLSEGRASRAERATANRLIFQSENRGDCAQMEMQALPGP